MPESDDLDLTRSEPPPAAKPLTVSTEPYDPTRDRERVRGRIAFIVVGVFAGVVLLPLGAAFVTSDETFKRLIDTLGVLLPAVATLVGAVTGFYYGEKAGRS